QGLGPPAPRPRRYAGPDRRPAVRQRLGLLVRHVLALTPDGKNPRGSDPARVASLTTSAKVRVSQARKKPFIFTVSALRLLKGAGTVRLVHTGRPRCEGGGEQLAEPNLGEGAAGCSVVPLHSKGCAEMGPIGDVVELR